MGSPVTTTLNMIKTLLVAFLICSVAFASPVPAEESEANEIADRGLVEDLLIGMIRDLIINQINAILGITTTTTACSGLLLPSNRNCLTALNHVYNNFSYKSK